MRSRSSRLIPSLSCLKPAKWTSIRFQKYLTARRDCKETNATIFAQQEATNASRIAALQANTCFCSSSDWNGRSHNDGCAAAAAARERERAALNHEGTTHAAGRDQFLRTERQQGEITAIEEVEPVGPPPVYMLVDEHGQMMMDEHGRKQRWQGRGFKALFQRRKNWGDGEAGGMS